jgi:hypothetical protein
MMTLVLVILGLLSGSLRAARLVGAQARSPGFEMTSKSFQDLARRRR